MNVALPLSALFGAYRAQRKIILEEEFGCRVDCAGRTKRKPGGNTRLVPASRLFQFYFDGLPRIGDFNPLAVSFPAFGDNLNQNFSEGRVGNVGDAFAVGLYVEFNLLVFAKFALFDVFQIDAGVFDGRIGIATDDFDANAIGLWSFRGGGGVW